MNTNSNVFWYDYIVCVFRCMWILTVMLYFGMTTLYVCIQVYVNTNSNVVFWYDYIVCVYSGVCGY